MSKFDPRQGIGTLVNHFGEGENPLHSHIIPIYQTSTFSFPDVAHGAEAFAGQSPAFIYTRIDNPNMRHLAAKIAALEGYDLLRANPEKPAEELVGGRMFASGMAAITAGILSVVKGGDTLIAQSALYSATYNFLAKVAPQYGIKVVFLDNPALEDWEAAFKTNPNAKLALAETPANPTMTIIDLAALAEVAHQYGAWLMVDNTFASPYCQRPLTLGADLVAHSTTKYLCGHGLVVGGVVVSSHVQHVKTSLQAQLEMFGGNPGPFDVWLTNIGLKTFELRMQRHVENGMAVARFLEGHKAVDRVYYPGLESHPQHALAKKQMLHFGGMISFELKGGFKAGSDMMNHMRVCTLAVSLGNADSLIQHPASMPHSKVAPEARRKSGLTDGLVRLSVGVENVEDIIADLDQAMA